MTNGHKFEPTNQQKFKNLPLHNTSYIVYNVHVSSSLSVIVFYMYMYIVYLSFSIFFHFHVLYIILFYIFFSFGQASHPLHLSLAYEGRPRSGSEPAPPRITPPHHQPHPNHAHTIHTVQHHHPYHQPSHIPRDIDPSLFSNDFKVDIQDVIQQELQYGGDFSLSAGTGAMETQSVQHHGQYSNNTAYTALNPNIHVHHGNYVATGHPTGHQFYTQSHDPTLTSVALDSSSPNLSRRPNPGY